MIQFSSYPISHNACEMENYLKYFGDITNNVLRIKSQFLYQSYSIKFTVGIQRNFWIHEKAILLLGTVVPQQEAQDKGHDCSDTKALTFQFASILTHFPTTKRSRDMIKSTILVVALVACILVQTQAQYCARLHGQCGGKNYRGPTCCQGSFVTCKLVNEWYSQCVQVCSQNTPCYHPVTRQCYAGNKEKHNGHNKPFCPRVYGRFTRCTNKEWCYESTRKCVCSGSRPCRIHYSGHCMPYADAKNHRCPGYTRRCPAAEHEKCGGEGWTGPTTCQDGLVCVQDNQYYSQCQDPTKASANSTSDSTPDSTPNSTPSIY